MSQFDEARIREWIQKTARKPRHGTAQPPKKSGKGPGRPKGARGIARDKLEADIAAGLPKEMLDITYSDPGRPCFKCGGVKRYISSGCCVTCSRGFDWRSEEDQQYDNRTQRQLSGAARAEALAALRPTFIGSPCKKCFNTTRITANGGCSVCTYKNRNLLMEAKLAKFHHDTSHLKFIEGERSVPEVYNLCPALAPYPGSVLVFTDQAPHKRLMGTDALLRPDLLTEYSGEGFRETDHGRTVRAYITFDAMQLAWRLFNLRNTLKRGNK